MSSQSHVTAACTRLLDTGVRQVNALLFTRTDHQDFITNIHVFKHVEMTVLL